MAGVQDQLEIKFRLTDGSDIGPKSFPLLLQVLEFEVDKLIIVKPRLCQFRLWFCGHSFHMSNQANEKENGPRTVKDVKLISAGRILENNRTVGEC
ncbi:hypothetical protein GBA52_028627 [Prunus armeniaca]|nr:hypothetical protein GBA52_028627 [Prunus armeniaca]